MPKSIQRRILAYSDKRDQAVRCISKLMLNRFSEEYGLYNEIALDLLQFNLEGKPYFPNTSFSFNNTHSGPMVLCASLRYGRVGIDTEQVRDVNFGDLIDHFSGNEAVAIKQSTDPHKMMLSLWTRKEAVMKASGMGILIELDEVEVLNNLVVINQREYYLHEVSLAENFVTHIATDRKDATIVLKEFCPGVPDFYPPDFVH